MCPVTSSQYVSCYLSTLVPRAYGRARRYRGLIVEHAGTVGLWPNTPQKAAGMRMLPPMSLPSPAAAPAAASSAASPPLLPPADRPAPYGFRVSPYAGLPPAAARRPAITAADAAAVAAIVVIVIAAAIVVAAAAPPPWLSPSPVGAKAECQMQSQAYAPARR